VIDYQGNPCPSGFSKVQAPLRGPASACLGRTNTGGCIYLCFARAAAAAGAGQGPRGTGVAFLAAALTEMYLCNIGSCQKY
jgi:hypothetical protein